MLVSTQRKEVVPPIFDGSVASVKGEEHNLAAPSTL